MTLGRIERMYSDKPPLYMISICVLCLGWGWLIAQYSKFGMEGILIRSFGLLVVVYFADAIIKSIFYIKEHFSINLELKFK